MIAPVLEEKVVVDGMSVERTEDGRLMARKPCGELVPVRAMRCFPWSADWRHVSLRDEENNEVAFIEDPRQLDAESRAAIEAGLAQASFVFEVTAVRSLETEFEIRNWKVETRQGPCTFQTRLDDWPRTTPRGGLLLRDVSGNLFHVGSPHRLDPHSRKLLWAFMD